MPHRYFTTEIADGAAVLRGSDAHHLARVMRAKQGDTVILCDGNAVEYTATITGFGDECVEFRVEPGYPSAAEPSVEVTLLAGYPKQDKLEQIIKHGVELGCTHFIPFFSRYCVAAPKKEEQKNERYNRIALEAAKQSGRGKVPQVCPMLDLPQALDEMAQTSCPILFYENATAPAKQVIDGAGKEIAVLIGSEGGFDESEVELAIQKGCQVLSLGKRILRCETAPLAALSIIMFETGNM